MKNILLAIVLISQGFKLQACPVDIEEYRNDVSQSMASAPFNHDSEVTEAMYNSSLELIRSTYTPIFRNLGLELNVEGSWADNSERAETSYFSKKTYKRVIYVSGGAARKKYMSRDGLLLTLCHEVGHNIGGFPKKPSQPLISTEGQSDYFATSKCMKLLLKGEVSRNAEIASIADLPPLPLANCREQYPEENDFHLCIRLAMASEEAGQKLYYSLWGSDFWGRYFLDTMESDSRKVEETNYGYPSAGCRAETYFKGALCNKDHTLSISDSDERGGVCHSDNGDTFGGRPSCWFAPKKL